MKRVDLLLPIHKGLRSTIFAAATQLGRCDFSDDIDASAALEAAADAIEFMAEHATLEDAVLMPALDPHAPELVERLAREHEHLEGRERALREAIVRVQEATPATRELRGPELAAAFTRYAIDGALHMDREEREVSPLVARVFDERQVAALRSRMTGVIPPPRLAEWMTIILPAVTPVERVAMVSGLRTAAPDAVWALIAEAARNALGATAWDRLIAQLVLPQPGGNAQR